MMRKPLRLLGAAVALTLVLAACGGDDNTSAAKNTTATTETPTSGGSATSSGGGSTPSSEAGQQKDVTVAYGETSLGDTLVDTTGKTLYLFDADSTGKSVCNAGCDGIWPPLMVTGDPLIGDGLKASLFTTITRDDGTKQLAVDGHPLYTYSGDAKTGDTNGQGILDKWYAASPQGKKLGDADAATTETTAKSSGRYSGY
jgi:predicted lipoprotein with Yx(FWY)xxD motif